MVGFVAFQVQGDMEVYAMTDEEKKRIIREQTDAFNRKDEEGFLRPISSSSQFTDVPTGEVLRGKDGGKENLRRWSTAFPDARVTIENVIVSGDTAVVQFTGEGTQRGPLGPFPASNKRAKSRMVNIFKFNPQGEIVEVAQYYDQLSMLIQLGHVPQPVGAGRR